MSEDEHAAMMELRKEGISIIGDPHSFAISKYIATAPNGEQYRLLGSDLLKLKAAGKLHLEGLQEAHLAKKDLHNL
jgi:hypothetical protein